MIPIFGSADIDPQKNFEADQKFLKDNSGSIRS